MPHLRTEFSSTVSLGYDFTTGNLNASLNGRWNWFVENFTPPPGFASSGGSDIGGGMGSNGGFTVDNNTASGAAFFAPYWANNFSWSPPGHVALGEHRLRRIHTMVGKPCGPGERERENLRRRPAGGIEAVRPRTAAGVPFCYLLSAIPPCSV